MKKKLENKQVHSDRIANAIARTVLSIQNRWVVFMKKQTGKLSLRKQKIVLIVFTVMFTCFCIHLIVGGFTSKPVIQKRSQQNNILVPRLQGDSVIAKDHSVDPIVISTLKDFYQKRDSLKQYAPQEWEWFIKSRPGLLDSMAQLERFIKKDKEIQP